MVSPRAVPWHRQSLGALDGVSTGRVGLCVRRILLHLALVSHAVSLLSCGSFRSSKHHLATADNSAFVLVSSRM